MSCVVAIHVRPRQLLNFVEEQFEDEEQRKLNQEAVDEMYKLLRPDADDDDPIMISFIETFATAAEMINFGCADHVIQDECLDTIEDIFFDYDAEEVGEAYAELILTFSLLLIDFFTVERGINDLLTSKVEFITLFHNRFDITFED